MTNNFTKLKEEIWKEYQKLLTEYSVIVFNNDEMQKLDAMNGRFITSVFQWLDIYIEKYENNSKIL